MKIIGEYSDGLSRYFDVSVDSEHAVTVKSVAGGNYHGDSLTYVMNSSNGMQVYRIGDYEDAVRYATEKEEYEAVRLVREFLQSRRKQ